MSISSTVLDICNLLTSSKITERSKGCEQCQKLIISEQSSKWIYSSQNWSELIISAYKYQSKEVESKSKSSTQNTTAIIKKIVKHASLYHPQAIYSRIEFILDSSMELMNDEKLPQYIRNEHKYIILELLSPTYSSFLSSKYFRHIFHSILKSIIHDDRRGLSDSFDQKLLKRLCQYAIRRDDTGYIYIEEMFQWMNQSLEKIFYDISSHLTFIISCMESFTYLIQNDGFNILFLLEKYSFQLLSATLYILHQPQYWTRENYRDTCITYLYHHVELFSKSVMDTKLRILKVDPMIKVLDSLIEILISDEFIIAVTQICYYKSSSNSDISSFSSTSGGGTGGTTSNINDLKTNIYYSLVVQLLYLQNCRQHNEKSLIEANTNDRTITSFPSSSQPLKRRKMSSNHQSSHDNQFSNLSNKTSFISKSFLMKISERLANESTDYLKKSSQPSKSNINSKVSIPFIHGYFVLCQESLLQFPKGEIFRIQSNHISRTFSEFVVSIQSTIINITNNLNSTQYIDLYYTILGFIKQLFFLSLNILQNSHSTKDKDIDMDIIDFYHKNLISNLNKLFKQVLLTRQILEIVSTSSKLSNIFYRICNIAKSSNIISTSTLFRFFSNHVTVVLNSTSKLSYLCLFNLILPSIVNNQNKNSSINPNININIENVNTTSTSSSSSGSSIHIHNNNMKWNWLSSLLLSIVNEDDDSKHLSHLSKISYLELMKSKEFITNILNISILDCCNLPYDYYHDVGDNNNNNHMIGNDKRSNYNSDDQFTNSSLLDFKCLIESIFLDTNHHPKDFLSKKSSLSSSSSSLLSAVFNSSKYIYSLFQSIVNDITTSVDITINYHKQTVHADSNSQLSPVDIFSAWISEICYRVITFLLDLQDKKMNSTLTSTTTTAIAIASATTIATDSMVEEGKDDEKESIVLPWKDDIVKGMLQCYFVVLRIQLESILKRTSLIDYDIFGLYLQDIYFYAKRLWVINDSISYLNSISEIVVHFTQNLTTTTRLSVSKMSDDMDISSSLSSSKVLSNSSNSNGSNNSKISSNHSKVAFDDDSDDDDKCITSTSDSRMKSSVIDESDKVDRVDLSEKVCDLLYTLIQLFYLSKSEIEHSRICILDILSSSHLNRKRSYSSQVLLTVARAMIDYNPIVIETFQIAINSEWDLELGMIGYYKILYFIKQLIMSNKFLHSIDRVMITEMMLKLIFAEEVEKSKIHLFPKMFWKCRILQIDCISQLIPIIREENMNYRAEITNLVKKFVIDDDIRVRIHIMKALEHILKLYEKKEKVYESLLRLSGVTICYNEITASYEILSDVIINKNSSHSSISSYFITICSTILITVIGRSSPSLYYRIMLDLLWYCCSSSTSTSSTSSISNSTTDDSNLTLSNSRFFQESNKILFVDLLRIISKRMGYPNIHACIHDNLHWLIQSWINHSIFSNHLSSNQNFQLLSSFLSFSSFPWHLIGSNVTYDSFIKDNCSYIFLCCLLSTSDSNIRLDRIRQYLVIPNQSIDDDQLIYTMICEHSSIIQATICLNHVIINNASGSQSESKNSNHNHHNADEIIKIYLGSKSSKILLSFTYLSEIVYQIFNLITQSQVNRKIQCIDETIEYYENVITKAILDAGSNFCLLTISSILNECNIVDIIALLYKRVRLVSKSSRFHSILASLSVIIKTMTTTQPIYLPSWICIQNVLVECFHYRPENLMEILSMMSKYIDLLLSSVEYSSILREIYYELISLHSSIVIVFQLEEYHYSEVESDIINFVQESYPRFEHQSISSSSFSSTSSNLVINKEHNITDMINQVNSCIKKILISSKNVSFELPVSYHRLLHRDIQIRICNSFQNQGILDKITSIIEFISQYSNGWMFSITLIWFEVLNLLDDFINAEINIKVIIILSEYSDICASFVSAMIDFVNISDINIPITLRNAISILLGYFGPPDIYSVSQSSIPNRFHGHNHQRIHGDMNKFMRDILLLISRKLWNSDPVISQCASITLHHLGSNRVLQRLKPSDNGNNKDKDYRKNGAVDFFNPLTKSITFIPSTSLLIVDDMIKLFSFGSTVIKDKEPIFNQVVVDIGDINIWSIKDHSYDLWITTLASHLLKGLMQVTHGKNDNHSLLLFADEIKSFLYPLQDIITIQSDVAEQVFPLILYSILLLTGSESELESQLEINHIIGTRINDILSCDISNSSLYMKNVRLCCRTIMYLIQLDIMSFKNSNRLISSQTSSNKITDINKSNSKSVNKWTCPIQIPFHLSYVQLAKACLSVGAVCSSISIIELGNEERRVNDSSAAAVTKTRISSSSSSTTTTNYDTNSFVSNNLSSVDSDILFGASRFVHDPDKVHGFMTEFDLTSQAAIFVHDGMWIEALSNYESMIRTNSSGNSSNNYQGIENVEYSLQNKILDALQGLGYDYLQQRISSLSSSFSIIQEDSNIFSTSKEFQRERDAQSTLKSWEIHTEDITESYISNHKNEDIWRLFHSFDHSSLLTLTKSSTEVSMSELLNHSYDEHAVFVSSKLSSLQQLLEIKEALTLVDEEINPMNNHNLFVSWKLRFKLANYSIKNTQKFITHRLKIIEILQKVNKISSSQVVTILDQLIDKMVDKYSTNAFVPLAYQLQHCLVSNIDPMMNNNNKNSSISSSLNLNMNNNSSWSKILWSFEESRILWKRGMEEFAISNLKSKVISVLKPFVKSMKDQLSEEKSDLLSESLRLGGEWLNSRRSATASTVLNEYFDPCLHYARSIDQILKSSKSLALFHTTLYANIRSKVTTPEWIQGIRNTDDRQKEIERCKEYLTNLEKQNKIKPMVTFDDDKKALISHVRSLQREVDYDLSERQAAEQSVVVYLLAAIKSYGTIIQHSKESDYDSVSQIINLWFSNVNNLTVNSFVYEIIKKSSSSKFVPLSYQLFSRLGFQEQPQPTLLILSNPTQLSSTSDSIKSNINFQIILRYLVTKLCTEHPYHTLPQLFALVHELELSGVKGAEHYKSNMSHNRQEMATQIVNELKKTIKIGNLVESYELLLLAYIDLANTSTKQYQDIQKWKGIRFSEAQSSNHSTTVSSSSSSYTSIKIPFDQVIYSLSEKPCIITIHFKIEMDGDYSDIIKIGKYAPKFSITETGLSRPKIIECIGSNGKIYTELVKGGDDMRQDAVMEQVFENVNETFSSDSQTHNRRLSLRTYKIVPLSPQTGVLQWVDNTKAFASYLIESDNNAHARFYPNDWSNEICRAKFKDTEQKLEIYHEICDHFHPVFRWFFMERFSDPVEWISAQLAYTKSVAAISVVGHILGIGDRHCQNILIDYHTGEVVHIDFGLTFEQARNLPVPEIVPFRLTRDIVDGMGISGCEGTFRRSCQHVLRVLRDHISQLMTILEVVIHDPLYKWRLSPTQARQKQTKFSSGKGVLPSMDIVSSETIPMESTTLITAITRTKTITTTTTPSATDETTETRNFGRDAAERTLNRIKLKLRGFEDPTGEALSVEGHIGLLINEATNPENLCRMFVGWAPWI